MTANPNHYARATSVACPSCGFPHRVIDSGTWLRKCQNDLDRYGNGAHIEGEGTISSYEWQKQQHPDREPTACNAQFFVHSHVQIIARVSTVQWEDDKPVSMDDMDSTMEKASALGNKLRKQLGADSNE